MILAVDPSPTCTCSVVRDGERIVAWYYTTFTKKWAIPPHGIYVPRVKRADESGRLARVQALRTHFKQLVKRHRPLYVALEDYVWGSQGKGGGIIQMSEVGGVLRMLMRGMGAQCKTYDPQTVHLFWTGKSQVRGESTIKDLMMDQSLSYLAAGKRSFTWSKGGNCTDRDELLALYDDSASRKYFEGVSDALAISELLRTEIAIRNGELKTGDLPDEQQRAFLRETKNVGSVLDIPFW